MSYNTLMQQLLNVYKPIFFTPLQIIDTLRGKFPEYKDVKIGYAGRLDPLAHGVLLLMIGEETKQREKYLNLPKTYEFEALFGIETDSYDVLGLPKTVAGVSEASRAKIGKYITSKLGTHTQAYPPYSSKAVGGKPLHWWAKQNRLSEIKIPEHEIHIDSFELLSTGEISAKELQKKVTESVTNVQGYFRQKEILETWNAYFYPERSRRVFQTAKFKLSCSSGTYIRGLVHELGEQLGSGAITTEILRTKVGEYSLEKSLRL